MSVNIRLKHSSVQDKEPLPTDLVDGELALNTNSASPAAYLKDSAGNIVKIAGKGAIGGTPATETEAGIAELATQLETNLGTNDETIVTPLKLQTKLNATVVPASETAAGIAEIATAAEVTAGTDDQRMVTPLKLQGKLTATGGTGNFGYWNRTGTVVSPTNAGDVVNISAGTAALPGLTPVGDPNTGVFSPGADQLALSTNGTGRLFVDASGNVGVGANPPSALAHISSSYATPSTGGISANTRLIVSNNNLASSEANISLLYRSNAKGRLNFGSQIVEDVAYVEGGVNYLAFGTGSGTISAAERLRITSAGLVGIGNSSPTGTLDVSSSTINTPLLKLAYNTGAFSNNTGNVLIPIDIAQNTTAGGAITTTCVKLTDTSAGGPFPLTKTLTGLHVDLSSSTYGTKNAAVFEGGRVGIGDTGPDSTLTIKAAASTTPLRVSGPSSEFLRCDQQGRLLVGTNTDSGGALLQVNGDRIRVATAKTPASATDTGTAGEICWDANYIYVCTATNTWKRTAIATW